MYISDQNGSFGLLSKFEIMKFSCDGVFKVYLVIIFKVSCKNIFL